MGKAIPLLVAGTGGTVVAAGGNFLLQRSGGSTTDGAGTGGTPATGTGPQKSVDTTSQIDTISNEISFKTLDDFKKANGGDCAKYFLNGSDKVDLSTGGTAINSNNKIDENYFSNGTDAHSCLIINWERTDTATGITPKKGKGNFKWVWSFVKGNKGFIMFTTTKLSSTAQQLDLEGGIYFLKKEGEQWSLDKHKTLDGSKNISKTNFTKVFPKVGDSLADVQNKDLWGFMSSDADLDDVCSKSEESTCTQTSGAEKKFMGSGLWSTGNGGKSGTLIKGCKDFESYFKSMYEVSEIDLKVNLETLSGTWSKKNLVEPQSSTNQ